MGQAQGIIRGLQATSGKSYGTGRLLPGELQYMDRDYVFNYVPGEIRGALHVRTRGNDKLVPEDTVCVTFEALVDVDVYVLYADKFPALPQWLEAYERTRLNVTRLDSRADNLKGYFGVYRSTFPHGEVVLHGCSTRVMLGNEWYVESGGANYCMYTLAVVPAAPGRVGT